jgi:type I restriction enzyme S subunit
MGWRLALLEEVAEVAAGNPAPQYHADFSEDGVPFIRMQDVGREHRTNNLTEAVDKVSEGAINRHRLRLFPAGSILIPKSGASVNLNHRAMLGRDAYVVSHLAVLVPRHARVLPEYLYFWSLAYDPRSQAQTTSLPSLPLSFIKTARIPVPPFDEQRRTVNILSHAEGIVLLRREAQKKAAELIPALFLDMFGDPAMNPKGWPVHEIGSLGRVQLGRQRTPKYQTGLHTRPYMRVANVFEDRIDTSNVLSMDFDEKDFAQYRLSHGDILLNEGQSTELVGRPAMWRNEINDCCFQNTLVRFQPTEDVMNPEFALAALIHYYRSGVLSQISSKTSNVAHLGGGRFAKLTLYCPPIRLQNDFTRKFEQVRSLRNQEVAATEKAEASFDALLAEIFCQAGAHS